MTTIERDLAVYGATPAGIFAALTAARCGRRAVLCAYGQHVGGLLSSGLSIANIRYRQAHGGPFAEFSRAVLQHYVSTYGPDAPQVRECRNGTWWEPHVAELVFESLLAAEPNVQLTRNVRLVGATITNGHLEGFTVQDRATGQTTILRAPVSIDATYEADLAVAAGVPYWVGREGRSEYWEPHAGVMNFSIGAGQEVWPGSTGEADKRIQAFCYRLSVTQDPARYVPFPRPETYNPDDYLDVRRPIEAGRVHRLSDVMHLGPERLRVNGKADVIANLVGGANDYPDADEATREAIIRHHRDYTLGLFWFLQHDPCVPEPVRQEALSWGLASDEFKDNHHFPYELYVREARRIRGRVVATEHDFMLEPGTDHSPLHEDAVAVADYYLDSHAMQHLDVPPYEEGHLNIRATQPGQVRWGSLLPKDVTGLIVPVAVSSTHAGFSVIRMEPVWTSLGAAAATAAHLAQLMSTASDAAGADLNQAPAVPQSSSITPDAVPVEAIQAELARHDQRLAFFYDVPLDLHSPGLQFFATKGFFPSFYARPTEPVTRHEAAHWLSLTLSHVTSTSATPDAPPAFPDVPATHPFYSEIQHLHHLGIVDGWFDSSMFGGTASLRRTDAHRWLKAAANHLAPHPVGLQPAQQISTTSWEAPDNVDTRPYSPITRVEFCDDLFTLLHAVPGPFGFQRAKPLADPKGRN